MVADPLKQHRNGRPGKDLGADLHLADAAKTLSMALQDVFYQ